MIVKIITLFLIFMAVLALFGRLRFPKLGLAKAQTCKTCGRHKIGKGPCGCGEDG